MHEKSWLVSFLGLVVIALLTAGASHAQGRDGSAERPLVVMLVPADGGTEDGTRADFLPLFNAITKTTNVHFEIKAGQSYATVIEGMCAGLADIAWFGAVSYLTARDRGCAELLAVEVTNGSAVYHAGLFVPAGSTVESIDDLTGLTLALGSMNSTSSFVYPLAMIIRGGLDPVNDFEAVYITGSHSNSLSALKAGQVDVAAASLVSYARAVNTGAINPEDFRALARSTPIPNPPLSIHPSVSDELTQTLKTALGSVHANPQIDGGVIRGYGGRVVDYYDATVTDDVYDNAVAEMALVDQDMKAAILLMAGTP